MNNSLDILQYYRFDILHAKLYVYIPPIVVFEHSYMFDFVNTIDFTNFSPLLHHSNIVDIQNVFVSKDPSTLIRLHDSSLKVYQLNNSDLMISHISQVYNHSDLSSVGSYNFCIFHEIKSRFIHYLHVCFPSLFHKDMLQIYLAQDTAHLYTNPDERDPRVDTANQNNSNGNTDNQINGNGNNLASTSTTDSQRSVVNLSDFLLTPSMESLLSKGLNFCPTPGEQDIHELRQDLDKFHVSLRRKQFFSKKVDPNTSLDVSLTQQLSNTTMCEDDGPFNHPKFKNPSNWNPIGPANLEAMIIFNEHKLNEYVPTSPPNQNLTPEEHQALQELKQNHNIVIKRADKGSAVVIQNRADYITEGLRQLNDPKFYIEVPNDLTKDHNQEVSKLITKLQDDQEISDKCAAFLYTAQPRTPQFYMLPKIHKNKTPVPGRPIISANNSPTEKISQLVDHFLQPIVSTTKSFVKDTTDFINKIEELPIQTQSTILCTIDVSSLYTNIPIPEGLAACKEQLDLHRPHATQPSNPNLIKLLELVLYKNNFDFNSHHYLQIGGTAMGTRVAPSFANLFMANFEKMLVYPYTPKPTIWLRYIDDIFLIWEHGQTQLDQFLEHLNGCHPTIKFTSDISTKEINFLDTTVRLDRDRKLYTTLYCKPTDSHNYLSFTSSHPQHTKKSLPFSQLLRVRRICTKLEDYDQNAVLLGTHFIRRGYPLPLIEEATIKARRTNRHCLLHPTTSPDTQSDTDNLFLINTYNPLGNPLKDILQTNWSILGRTHTTTGIYSNKVIYGNRRNKNLQDILVHAKLPELTASNTPKVHTPSQPLHICETKNCRYCKRLDHTGHITSTSTSREYNTRKYVSCKSNNLIYCITCTTCNKQYVGQTKNRLQDRFQMHFYHIESKKQINPLKRQPKAKKLNPKFDDPIGRHFKQSDHNGLNSIHIHILQFISAPSESIPAQMLRDDWERKWIHRLKTIAPLGLNSAD